MSPAVPPLTEILVVDDTPDNLRLLMELLIQHGYRVRPVTDGALAITAAQLQPPDLVLLDIKMPDPDGYTVCEALKADERTRDIPVVFLTVLDEPVDKVQGFAVGGVEYITKPFEAMELLARVENQLRLRSLQQQLIEQNRALQYLLDQYETATLALQESEEKFSKAFHSSPLPITLSSIHDGCYLDINDAFVQKSGYTRADLIGTSLLDLEIWVDLRDRDRLFQQLYAQGYVHDFETQQRTKTGHILDVVLFLEIVQLNGTDYVLTTGEDITRRKAAEQALTARTEELAQALHTLTATQTQLVQSAKMAALGNLVAGVAHEINTPVGTAIMMASTLENATGAIATDVTQGQLTQTAFTNYLDTARDASHLILENLNRAGELVQSFKQVAVDQTSLQDRMFAIKPYLEDVITSLTPQIKRTPHTVTISGSDTLAIHSYPGALSQIVTNLVVNALTHGFAPAAVGHIHIHVAQQCDRCVVTFSDDGIGIPAEHLEKIFEPFFTTARHQGGSGLGLHLVYNLVTQTLKGQITVTSTPSQGTTFILTLPPTLADPQ